MNYLFIILGIFFLPKIADAIDLKDPFIVKDIKAVSTKRLKFELLLENHDRHTLAQLARRYFTCDFDFNFVEFKINNNYVINLDKLNRYNLEHATFFSTLYTIKIKKTNRMI